jgi:hypothetical protein
MVTNVRRAVEDALNLKSCSMLLNLEILKIVGYMSTVGGRLDANRQVKKKRTNFICIPNVNRLKQT